MTKQKLSITPTYTYHSNHQAPDIIPSLPYTHHHINFTMTIQNISQKYKTSKSRQKSPETIKEPKERHHTKISFVKTSVPQENTPRKAQRKTPYKKIPCVVPHQLFTNNFRSSITTHCRFPASQSPNAPRRTYVRHC